MKALKLSAVLTILVVACQQPAPTKTDLPSEPTIEFKENFVHSVYFWLKNPESAEDRTAFEKSLKKLLRTSKYTKTNYLGTPPTATRDVVDGSFTYHLLLTFPSAEAQEGYQGEEAHLIFIEESSDLWEKVIVYDSEVIE